MSPPMSRVPVTCIGDADIARAVGCVCRRLPPAPSATDARLKRAFNGKALVHGRQLRKKHINPANNTPSRAVP